jgi:hypothetical protein
VADEAIQASLTQWDYHGALNWMKAMVLLPKPDGSSCGIGLLEGIWKLLASINNGQLKVAISCHDALHASGLARHEDFHH